MAVVLCVCMHAVCVKSNLYIYLYCEMKEGLNQCGLTWPMLCLCVSYKRPCFVRVLLADVVSDQRPYFVRVWLANVVFVCVRPATMLRAGLTG